MNSLRARPRSRTRPVDRQAAAAVAADHGVVDAFARGLKSPSATTAHTRAARADRLGAKQRARDACRQGDPGDHHQPGDLGGGAAARFGIDSLRARLPALRAARSLAALDGAGAITDDYPREAAELVYPSRATMLPDDSDRAVPARVSKAAAQALPRTRCKLHSGPGHLMHEERPQIVADEILAWLGPAAEAQNRAACR